MSSNLNKQSSIDFSNKMEFIHVPAIDRKQLKQAQHQQILKQKYKSMQELMIMKSQTNLNNIDNKRSNTRLKTLNQANLPLLKKEERLSKTIFKNRIFRDLENKHQRQLMLQNSKSDNDNKENKMYFRDPQQDNINHFSTIHILKRQTQLLEQQDFTGVIQRIHDFQEQPNPQIQKPISQQSTLFLMQSTKLKKQHNFRKIARGRPELYNWVRNCKKQLAQIEIQDYKTQVVRKSSIKKEQRQRKQKKVQKINEKQKFQKISFVDRLRRIENLKDKNQWKPNRRFLSEYNQQTNNSKMKTII